MLMKITPDRRRSSYLEFAPLLGALAVSAIGCLVLVGWYFHLVSLHDIHPVLGTMGAEAAFCFVLAGVGLALLAPEDAARWRRHLGHACAGALVFLSVSSLVTSASGWRLNLDQRLFHGAIGQVFPLGMPWASAVAFLTLGLALLLLDVKARFHPAEIAGSIAALLVLLALVAYG